MSLGVCVCVCVYVSYWGVSSECLLVFPVVVETDQRGVVGYHGVAYNVIISGTANAKQHKAILPTQMASIVGKNSAVNGDTPTHTHAHTYTLTYPHTHTHTHKERARELLMPYMMGDI